MPGCVLRASGRHFDVDRFLERSAFEPCAVFHTGEPRIPGSTRLSDSSGFNLVVSAADGDSVPVQIREAAEFVRTRAAELRQLVVTAGVEAVVLDFGWNFPCEGAQFNHFPAAFLADCGGLGICIEVSVYATAET